MIDLMLRMGLLMLVTGVAWMAVGGWQRRSAAAAPVMRPGLTVITGPGCHLCEPVVRELRRVGADPWVVDVAELPPGTAGASSLPVAVVVDGDGKVVLRRAGRAALEDAAALAGAVR